MARTRKTVEQPIVVVKDHTSSFDGPTIMVDPTSELSSAIDKLVALRAEKKRLAEEEAVYIAQIKEEMGENVALLGPDGTPRVTWMFDPQGRRTLDENAMIAAGIDTTRFEVFAKPSRRFLVK